MKKHPLLASFVEEQLAEMALGRMLVSKCFCINVITVKHIGGADLRIACVLTLEEAKTLFPKYFSRES